MSWLFSQALVEAYLGDTFLDGEQSVLLNGSNTQQAYCAPDKMTAFSRLSRFGMTYKPLTENRGEELLMSYRAGFHAKTSPLRGGGRVSMENEVECGEKWQGSFVKYSPDSCSWKTHQCSLLGDLEEFSETWPAWGLMFNGECWDMTGSVVNTGETEFGLLATPTKELFSHWSSAKAKISTGGKRKSGVKVGSILWWDMTEQHLRLGGQEEKKMIPDPSCGEVVMGWPMGWTELRPLATDKFQEWLRQHGVCLVTNLKEKHD
jgi:hypothetical protein